MVLQEERANRRGVDRQTEAFGADGVVHYRRDKQEGGAAWGRTRMPGNMRTGRTFITIADVPSAEREQIGAVFCAGIRAPTKKNAVRALTGAGRY